MFIFYISMETLPKASLSGILSYAAVALKRYRVELTLIALFLWCISMIGNFYLGTLFADNPAFANRNGGMEAQGYEQFTQLVQEAGKYAPSLIFLGLAFIIIMIVSQVLALKYIFSADSAENNQFTYLLQESFKKVLPTVGTNIIQTIFLIGLFILLIVPGVIFAVFRSFSFMIVADQRVYFVDALRESKRMVKGRRRRTLGHFILIAILLIVIDAAVSAVFGALASTSGSEHITYGIVTL